MVQRCTRMKQNKRIRIKIYEKLQAQVKHTYICNTGDNNTYSCKYYSSQHKNIYKMIIDQ